MATVKIDQFHGIAPLLHPTLLPDGMAVTAHNCRLKNGKLVPLREPSFVETANIYFEDGLSDIAAAMSMHIWRDMDGSFAFLLFPGLTWAAQGNVADDSLTRLVVSGETGAAFWDADGKLHVNTPVVYVRQGGDRAKNSLPIAHNAMSAPYVRRVSEEPLEDSRLYTRFFVTWVDELGMESPPSPASLLADGSDKELEYMDGDEVAVWIPGGAPPEAVTVRIYKVVAGLEMEEGGRAWFIHEAPAAQFAGGKEVSFAKADTAIGETMPEIEAPPPDLSCIQNVPGSFYVGFSPSSRKTVCFSDVDLLYSWPVAYRYDVADNIVALAVTSNTVFVLTEGWPWVITGTAPESMTVSKVAGPAACVSARGVCVYRNNVYFASNEGLMSIVNGATEGTVCTNITQKAFSKDQWQALNPKSCLMEQHDGALHLFFELPDGTHKGVIVDLNEAANAITTHDEAAQCTVTDSRTDDLYYIRAS